MKGFFYVLTIALSTITALCFSGAILGKHFFLLNILPTLSPFMLAASLLGIIASVLWYSENKIVGLLLFLNAFSNLTLLYFQIGLCMPNENIENSFKIISYNTQQLIHYQNDVEKLALDLLPQNADIICLQEFGAKINWQKKDSIIKLLAEATQLEYYHFLSREENIYGLALLSKYPIIGAKELGISLHGEMNHIVNYSIQLADKKQINLVHFHLYSNNLFNEQNENNLRIWRTSLKTSFFKRKEQIENILEFLRENQNQATILLGDANIIPFSQEYFELKNSFQDAALNVGSNLGFTHAYLPLRIDYFFGNNYFEFKSLHNIKTTKSDHKMLVLQASLGL